MITAVLIHGFSGSPESWRCVASLLDARTYAPAVFGHGGGGSSVADADPVGAFEAEVDRLAAEIANAVPPPRFAAGYSLGGRLTLGLLVRRPELIAGAALIGINPGLDDEEALAARERADESWARCIDERGLAAFDREWSALPLFGSQSRLEAEALEDQRRIRLSHDPAGLAAAMRALSLAAMPNYGPALSTVACPVELIAGGLDAKFKALALRMAPLLPRCRVHIVDGVGHNIPLEAPAELARLLNEAMGPMRGGC